MEIEEMCANISLICRGKFCDHDQLTQSSISRNVTIINFFLSDRVHCFTQLKRNVALSLKHFVGKTKHTHNITHIQ